MTIIGINSSLKSNINVGTTTIRIGSNKNTFPDAVNGTFNLYKLSYFITGGALTPNVGDIYVPSATLGLIGQYFNGDWRATISTGNIGTIPLSSPTTFSAISYGSRGDYYGFIAIGWFVPPTTGTYTFYTSSDDGSGVWVGDIASAETGRTTSNAVVNNGMGSGHGDTKVGGSIALDAGVAYPIRIVHEEGTGGDNLTFSWAGPGIAETTYLANYFYFNSNTYDYSYVGNVGYIDSDQTQTITISGDSDYISAANTSLTTISSSAFVSIAKKIPREITGGTGGPPQIWY